MRYGVLRSSLFAVISIGSIRGRPVATPSWKALSAVVGPLAVPERVYDQRERLFGSANAELVLWRDDAAWCPFCEVTWLVLEKMAVPYQMKTVPLRRYLLPGEVKDPEYTDLVGAAGVVPGVQFCTPTGQLRTPETVLEDILCELWARYPSRFPAGDAAIRTAVCGGDGSLRGRHADGLWAQLVTARRQYEACAGASSVEGRVLAPLAAPLERLEALLAASDGADDGPFLGGGHSPSVSDLLLLPFLSRVQAVVPYFFGEKALVALPFARCERYLRAARASFPLYAELSSDSTTLARTNLRYARSAGAGNASPQREGRSAEGLCGDASAAAVIDGIDARTRDLWAVAATARSRYEAAARLVAAPEAIAAFAQRAWAAEMSGAAEWAAAAEAEVREADAREAEVVDEALRAVASVLLASTHGGHVGSAAVKEIHRSAQAAAEILLASHGSTYCRAAAEVLEALSLYVGVPRDMGMEPARALRSHLRIVTAALYGTLAAE